MLHPLRDVFAQFGWRLLTVDDLRAAGPNGRRVLLFVYGPRGNSELLHMRLRVVGKAMGVLECYSFTDLQVIGPLTPYGMGLMPCSGHRHPSAWTMAFVICAESVTQAGLASRLGTLWENLVAERPNVFCPEPVQDIRSRQRAWLS